MISPLVNETNLLNVNYYFGAEYWLQNGNKTISTLQVDFGDGSGYQTVAIDATIAVSYSFAGVKYVKSLITYSDASTLITYSAIKVNGGSGLLLNGSVTPMSNCSMVDKLPRITTTETFQGYTETSAKYGVGDVTVFYHTNNGCDEVIRKPVIVVDGFDPGSERIPIDPLREKSIYAQLEYNNGANNMGDDLRAQGYDVIILDFPKYSVYTLGIPGFPRPRPYYQYIDGGTDYIERNALVLKQLIRNMNLKLQQIGSSEKLVVVGPSMGGLIARYALAKMEQASEPHNTRLFVSFDSPHMGANIPLGDQLYIDFYARRGIESAKISRDEKLASTAAKQMLRMHYLSSQQGNSFSTYGAPGFRNRFQTELDNTGWPQFTRNIAVINGRIDGGLDYSSCGIALESNTKLTIGKHIPWLPASSATVKLMPTSGTDFCKIFDGKYIFKHSFYRIKTTDLSIANIDTAPGGLFDTQNIIRMEGAGSMSLGVGLYSFTSFYVPIPTHSFIPTISSLALTNGLTRNLTENLSNTNLVTTGETPFQTYYAPNNNEAHVSLSACSAAWVTNEIKAIFQPPFIGQYKIQGPTQLCTSENYTIPNLPSGAIVNWTIFPSTGIASLTTSGNTATLTKTGDGNVQLSATINSTCGNIPITPVNISVGAPVIRDFTIDFNVFDDLCRPQDRYTILATPGATYSWSVNNPKILLNQQAGNSCLVYGGPITQGTSEDFELTVTVTNACGTATSTYLYGYYYKPTREECLNNQYSRYAIYPNPANSDLTIEYVPILYTSNKKTTISSKQKDIKLFNNKGEIMISSMMKENELKLVLDIKNIPDGTYFLHITEDKETIKKQIIIKH